MMNAIYYETDYLMHHGILGQKWGIRRFQNKNGSLTAAGRKRYDTDDGITSSKKANSSSSNNSFKNTSSEKRKAFAKKVAIGAGVTAAIIAAGYGAKKVSDIRELKGDLRAVYGSDRFYDRSDVRSQMAANWDRYSLKTKSTLAKAAKKSDLLKLEAFADDIKTKKTVSTKIGDALDRRDEKKRVIREGKELYNNARKAAQQAYLNKRSDSQAKIDAFKAIQDSAYSNRTFGQKVGTKVLAKATQGRTSKKSSRDFPIQSVLRASDNSRIDLRDLSARERDQLLKKMYQAKRW